MNVWTSSKCFLLIIRVLSLLLFILFQSLYISNVILKSWDWRLIPLSSSYHINVLAFLPYLQQLLVVQSNLSVFARVFDNAQEFWCIRIVVFCILIADKFLNFFVTWKIEDMVSKFKSLHSKLDIKPSSTSYEKLIHYCCGSSKVWYWRKDWQDRLNLFVLSFS